MNTIEKETIEQNRLNKLQHHLFGQPIKISLASSRHLLHDIKLK